ncbi:hypothetical protein CRV15_33770 (plasmid) [Streptomyces clavuligerus]|nr:hypothetical protein D1794_33050 [Streptomyces clavuligerus]QCS10506.1 hypothetical protein CRV15_33770 [Streptomyces clavuligerus]
MDGAGRPWGGPDPGPPCPGPPEVPPGPPGGPARMGRDRAPRPPVQAPRSGTPFRSLRSSTPVQAFPFRNPRSGAPAPVPPPTGEGPGRTVRTGGTVRTGIGGIGALGDHPRAGALRVSEPAASHASWAQRM